MVTWCSQVGWMYLTDSKRLDKMMCLLGLG